MIKLENSLFELKNLPTWEDKYTYLIRLGEDLESMSEAEKTAQNLISGCTSRAWIVSDYDLNEGKINFRLDSDSLIVKGLGALLIMAYSNQKPQEVLEKKLDFLQETEVLQNISLNRQNGLVAIVKRIKLEAIKVLKEEEAF